RAARLRISDFLGRFDVPITATLVIASAFLFSLFLKDRYGVTVREGANVHMYLASAFLFMPTIAASAFTAVAETVVRYPASPVVRLLFPVSICLVAWILYAVYRAGAAMSAALPQRNGARRRFDAAWLALSLVVVSMGAALGISFLIGLLAAPLTRVVMALNA
ncbi:MAG: hypothetical protein MJB57_10980, partial [Gemmatimonadetes bacterium]|nr:hypothetical protein [Gemmatimonadota bacterium]